MEDLQQPAVKGLNLLAEALATSEQTTPDAGNVHIGAGGKTDVRGGTAQSVVALPTATLGGSSTYVIEEDPTHGAPPAQLVCTGGQIYRTTNDAAGALTGTTYLGAYRPALAAGEQVGPRPFGVGFVDTVIAAPAETRYTIITAGRANPSAVPLTGAIVPVTHGDWATTAGYPNGFPTTCASYSGRMWYAGVDMHPARLYVTDSGSASTFAAGGGAAIGFTLDMQLTSGGRIIGLLHLYDILLVFTNRGTYRIVPDATGTVPFKALRVSDLSAVSPHACVAVEDNVYILAAGGVYRISTALTYGDVKSEEVSPLIAPVFSVGDEWRLKGAFGLYHPSTRRVQFYFEHGYTGFAADSAVTPEMTVVQAQAAIDGGFEAYPPSVTHCMEFDLRGESWARHYWPFGFDFAVSRDRGDGTYAIEAYTTRDPALGTRSTTTLWESELFDTAVTTDGALGNVVGYFRSRQLYKTDEGISRRQGRAFIHSDVNYGTPVLQGAFDMAAFTTAATLAAGLNRTALTGSGKVLQVEYSGSGWGLHGYSLDRKLYGRR